MIYIKLPRPYSYMETLSGDEIRDLILKNIKPTRSFKEDEIVMMENHHLHSVHLD